MVMTKSNKFWASFSLLLIIVIVVGGIIIWSKYSRSQPIEIMLSPATEISGQISVTGAVNAPGIYPLKSSDSIDALLQAAGGATTEADLNGIRFYIPTSDETEMPQKVNLNRAEAWLLQALPGIGETKAQAIIDYCQQNGGFRHISEITEVEGIGAETYEKIKNLVTVSD
jgi:competence protein ComEA